MILLTGGAGYIGSHTGVALAQAGLPYVVLDNFCNSVPEVLPRMAEVGGVAPVLVRGDVRDAAVLDALFARYPIQGAIRRGLQAVGESVADPARYYDNNVAGSLSLVQAMQRAGVKLVFSSSATVYGADAPSPLESRRWRPSTPMAAASSWSSNCCAICRFRPGLARGLPALLQPGGGACQRPPGRGPARRARQSDALHRPGGGGAARCAAGVRQRLPHARRHRRARLHPCDGPGQGHLAAWRHLQRTPAEGGNCLRQPGHGAGRLGAADGAGL
jgi:hypothetical protein